MEKNYITESLQFQSHPLAIPSQIIQFGSYRVTVLGNDLFRIEYSSKKIFEDRPTQIVWNRNLKIDYSHQINGNIHLIQTQNWRVEIDETLPLSAGLKLISLNSLKEFSYPLKDQSNLLGTYRTLDGADGKVPLENGLISRDGMTMINDAKSLTFENGMISSENVDDIDLYVFGYGHHYKECIKDYYLISGKTPLIPKYVFGNWWSRYWNYTDSELQALIENFQYYEIPLSVCIIDMDWHITNVPAELRGGWTGYTWNKDYFPNPPQFMKWLKDQGLKVSLNLHPADGIRPFDDCYEAVCRRMGKDPKNQEIIDFDLTNPQFVEAYFKDVHQDLERQGVDFWWIDWQQGTKSKMANLDPLFALNHYHLYDGINRGKKSCFIFSRWAGLGGHRYPIGFSGDSQITWNSLKYQPEFTATASNVGFGWWSHDIGGHFQGSESEDLYTRWVQFGVFSPVMRLHSTKSYYHKREPWLWNKEVLDITSKYLRFRHQLIPYIHTFNHLHSDGELPLITPMYYHYPEIKRSYQCPNQYYFGTELMVLPFTSTRDVLLNKSKETMWFPEKNWFNFFTGEQVQRKGKHTLYGGLSDINLYAKPGAIIPLATYFQEGVSDLPSSIDIHVFPGSDNQFTFIEDENDKIISSIITLKSEAKHLSLSLHSLQALDKKRVLNLKFRSVRRDSLITCLVPFTETYDEMTSTLTISLEWMMNQELSVQLTSEQDLIQNPYQLNQEIMRTVLNSRYSTDIKNTVGFINHNNPHESRGWLGWNHSLKDKKKALKELAVPEMLKKYLEDTLHRL